MTLPSEVENRYLDTIPKLASFTSLIFLLGSLWHEGLHYNFFGVNIFSYISITEALNLFVLRLPLMIAISIGVILFFWFFQISFEKPLQKLYSPKINRRYRMKVFFKQIIVLTLIFLLPFLSFMVFIPSLIHGSVDTEQFLFGKAFFILFNVFYMFNVVEGYSKGKTERPRLLNKKIFITLALTFFIVIYYYHRWEILKILRPNHDWKLISYTIKMKNGEFITTSDSINIMGKTKEYLFVLAPRDGYNISSVRIIKMDDVSELTSNRVIKWRSVMP